MRTVWHYDEDGVRKEVELLEGKVSQFFHDQARRYGFVLTANGQSYFFHLNNMTSMDGYGVEKLRYVPRFHHRHERVLKTPAKGDSIVFVLGKDRQDRVCVDTWSYPAEYENALKICGHYVELEKERLETNPKFRYRVSTRYPGSRNAPYLVEFEGTRDEFALAFPMHSYPTYELIQKQVGDGERLGLFERETETVWEPCSDPRKIKLKVSSYKANELLWACERSVRNAEEVLWHMKPRDLTYVRDETRPLVAVGVLLDGDTTKPKIVLQESPDYLETEFTGEVASRLWTAGHQAVKT